MKVVACLLAFVLASPLPAQKVAAADSPDSVIRTTSQEVLLDVVVRDKKGKLIRDIKADEIQVTDDGSSQKIRSFRLRNGAEIVSEETPGEKIATAAPAAPKLNPAREVRLVTLAFDRLGSEGRKLSLKAATDILQTEGGPNLYWAVFMIDQHLAILQQYTNDKVKLQAAVDKATAASYSLYTEESDRISKELAISSAQDAAGGGVAPTSGAATSGQMGSMVQASMAQMTLNMLQFADTADRGQQGMSQLFALAGMIKEQKRMTGRKTLIYFTGGLNIPPEREDLFKKIIADANRANVTVYCIDANGLGTGKQNSSGTDMLGQASRASAANMTKRGGPVTPDEAQVFDKAENSTRANPQVSLDTLSKDTGGFLVANTNDFRAPLRKVNEEINTYYEVTYTPSIDKYDGHFRKVSVSVNRSDAKVQTRSGYFALPSIAGQEDLLAYEVPMYSALSTTPIQRAIGFRASTRSFQSKSGTPETAIVFDVPLENISLVKEEADKTFRLHMSLLGLFKDSQGAIVQKVSRDVPSKGSLENLDATRAGHFIYTQHLNLPPGRYTLETAVLDRENMKIGVKKQIVIVTAPSKELGISSLTLVRKLAPTIQIGDPEDPFEFKGTKITPELNDTVKGGKGAGIAIYMVAYGQKDQDAKLAIEFMQDGKLVARSEPPMPKADETGRINYVASMPIESLKPGQYEVYAKVFQGGKGVQERMLINIEE